MKISKIKELDITNGEGIRISLFVSGCEHKCKNCFNEETWDFNYGVHFNEKIKNKIVETLKKEYVDGISILGGEPLHPKNIFEVIRLVEFLKHKFPLKTIWVWTGFTFEELISKYDMRLFKGIDVLIDGRFNKDLYSSKLLYRGSSNQRVLDLKKTLEENKIILYKK